MAVTLDALSNGYATATTTITVAHTVAGSDRSMGVIIGNAGSVPPDTVTFNGTSLTFDTQSDGGFGRFSSFWNLKAPATGTHNIVATYTVPTTDICLTGMSVNGSTGDIDSVYSAQTNFAGSPATVDVTLTTVSGDMMFTGLQLISNFDKGLSVTAGTQAGIQLSMANSFYISGYRAASGASTTVTFQAGGGWATPGIVGGVFRAGSQITSLIKTISSVPQASMKTMNGLVNASVKSVSGVPNV